MVHGQDWPIQRFRGVEVGEYISGLLGCEDKCALPFPSETPYCLLKCNCVLVHHISAVMALSPRLVSVLAVASSWLASTVVAADPPSSPPELMPVPLTNVGSGDAGTDTSLRNSEAWFYGIDSKFTFLQLLILGIILRDPGSQAHANLSGSFQGGYQMATSMDRFVNMVKSATCSSNQDAIIITFKDAPSYTSANQDWDWVNQGTFRSVFMTVNMPECLLPVNDLGSGVGRQAYQVNGVTWDDSQNMATLKAVPKQWKEVIGQDPKTGNSWWVEIDSRGFPKPSGQNTKRFSDSTTVTISVGHDFGGTILTQTVDGVDIDLECSQCATSGSLEFTASFGILPFFGAISVMPSGLGATVVLSLTASGTLGQDVSKSVNLVSTSLPGGFTFLDCDITIGPQLIVDVSAGITGISGQAELSFGGELTVPNSAIASVGFGSGGPGNQFSGWGPTFTPILPNFQSNITVTANAGPRIIVALEASISSIFLSASASAGLALFAPVITGTLDALTNSNGGVCGLSEGVAGLDFDLNIGAELDAFAGEDQPTNLPNKEVIFTTSADLFSTCTVLLTTATTFPGAGPTASSTASPSASPSA